MAYKSFIKENADGSTTEGFTITGPGYRITKRVTTYEFDNDEKPDIRPSDSITIKKVKKCDECKNCKKVDKDLENLIKELSNEDDFEETLDDVTEAVDNVASKYSADELQGLYNFIKTEMLKKENSTQIIDFLMDMYKKSKE